MSKSSKSVVNINHLIFEVRGRRIVLDEDLARLYQVSTKAFNQAVKRNLKRFPKDFMFRITTEEYKVLRSQIVTSRGRTGRRTLPKAFTEHGAVMAATVLNSELAIETSIVVVRAFIKAKELLEEHSDLEQRLNSLEIIVSRRFSEHKEELREIRFLIDQLSQSPKKSVRKIGFREDD